MGTGIIVCGMNGSGKSTLGRALSEQLGFHFIDIEDLVKSRPEDMAEKWAEELKCPILRVDGTKTVDEILKKCMISL